MSELRRPLSLNLWLLNTAAITASVSIYLACGAAVLAATGSLFQSSMVFALQWAGPLLVFGPVNRLLVAAQLKTVIAAAAAASLPVALLVLLLDNPTAPYVLAFVLGGLETIIKITRLLVIKRFAEADAVGSVTSFTSTGQFVGGALGGVVFAVLSTLPDRLWLALVCAGLYLIAFVCACLLPAGRAGGSAARNTLQLAAGLSRTLREHPALAWALAGLVAVCGLLQGFHNVARVGLPVTVWGGGEATVGHLQTVVAVSAILGAAAFMAVARRAAIRHRLRSLAGLCVLLMLATTLATAPLAGYVLYALFIFSFELLFFFFQTEVVKTTAQEDAPVVISLQFLLINIVMFASAGLGGALAESAGYPATAAIYGLMLALFVFAYAGRRFRDPAG